jgi:hypothetical protein
MISKLHNRLGTAGFVIAIIALIAALTGTAFAAGALTGKQKKEVEKIAKKYAGKNGAPGVTGPAGPKGDAGAKGDAGPGGAAGAAGKDGTSVTSAAASGAECSEGGTKFTSASGSSHVCNGEEGVQGQPGSPWTAGGTLPSGAIETGAYTVTSEAGTGAHFGEYAQTTISFSIPLAAELAAAKVVWVKAGETTPTTCENSGHAGTASPSNPEASIGFLCVFEGNSQNFDVVEKGIFTPDGSLGEGTGVSGALLLQKPTGPEAFAEGTWAVTAP